ncbi:hypothetical protein C0J52_00575 [Blattella germanica]|nr:hypothetical protein C0J52_00575 [Blattella germanica]
MLTERTCKRRLNGKYYQHLFLFLSSTFNGHLKMIDHKFPFLKTKDLMLWQRIVGSIGELPMTTLGDKMIMPPSF